MCTLLEKKEKGQNNVAVWVVKALVTAAKTVRLFFLDYFFGLMLNVPVNNFSVMLGRSHRFLCITSTFFFFFFFFFWGGGGIYLAQEHNTVTRVGLDPPTSGSGVRGVNHQATAPPVRY